MKLSLSSVVVSKKERERLKLGGGKSEDREPGRNRSSVQETVHMEYIYRQYA